jgi:hypothetical protein
MAPASDQRGGNSLRAQQLNYVRTRPTLKGLSHRLANAHALWLMRTRFWSSRNSLGLLCCYLCNRLSGWGPWSNMRRRACLPAQMGI